MNEGLPPGPLGVPLLGHLPWMVRDVLGFFTGLAREHGDLTTFRMGNLPCVLVNAPSLIEQLMRDRQLGRLEQTRSVMRVSWATGSCRSRASATDATGA